MEPATQARPAAGWALTRLRDRALVALATYPELTPQILSGLDAYQVHQDDRTGVLTVYYRDEAMVRLGREATSSVLDYLEAARLWGARSPLFPTRGRRGHSRPGDRLGPRVIQEILRRRRGHPQ
ncbi:MAG: hypothetical protein AAGD06_22475 [Acidobacteriota bacterium]